MPFIGVTLDTHTDFLPAGDVVALAKKIETLGFESLWLSDAFSREPLALAAWLLAKTETLKVGTAIANVYGRDADSAAQVRKTLGEASGGRFLLGLGVSNKYMNDMRKAEWVPPLKKMGPYLDQLNSAVVASAEGTAPVYVAAHAEGLAKLGRDKANGILTWTMPTAHTASMRALLGEGPHISAQLPVIPVSDPVEARQIGRDYLTVWLGLPSYRTAWAEIAGMTDADFENGGSDRLIDTIVAWGDEAAIRKRIGEYEAAGATRVIIEPLRKAQNAAHEVIEGHGKMAADWDALDRLAPVLLR